MTAEVVPLEGGGVALFLDTYAEARALLAWLQTGGAGASYAAPPVVLRAAAELSRAAALIAAARVDPDTPNEVQTVQQSPVAAPADEAQPHDELTIAAAAALYGWSESYLARLARDAKVRRRRSPGGAWLLNAGDLRARAVAAGRA